MALKGFIAKMTDVDEVSLTVSTMRLYCRRRIHPTGFNPAHRPARHQLNIEHDVLRGRAFVFDSRKEQLDREGCFALYAQVSEQALKKQASKKAPDAYLQLADLYIGEYRFDEAKEAIANYVSYAKTPVPTGERQRIAEKGAEMLLGVNKIAIIDSVVVDKAGVFEAYHLSQNVGALGSDGFVTGMGNKSYIEQGGELWTRTKRLNEWGTPERLPAEINVSTTNYAFLASDGITFYFASKGHDSMGGYDLFVTRYNALDNTFMPPAQMGFPFNSSANDYLLIIDDENGVGWFASDRRQPEGKVCVYTFIPSDTRETYDIDATDPQLLRRLAMLTSIKDTQSPEMAAAIAERRPAANANNARTANAFDFVIDDKRTYHDLQEFKNKQANDKARLWLDKVSQLNTLRQKLGTARDSYASANAAARNTMSTNILAMEQQEQQLRVEIKEMEKEIRRLEK